MIMSNDDLVLFEGQRGMCAIADKHLSAPTVLLLVNVHTLH